MQAIEIIAYVLVATLVCGLIVAFIMVVPHEEQYEGFLAVFKRGEGEQYRVTAADFAAELVKRWQECRYGIDEREYSVYVKDASVIDRDALVSELLRIDRCDVVDCRNDSGGFTVRGAIATPKVINIRCFNNTLTVS